MDQKPPIKQAQPERFEEKQLKAKSEETGQCHRPNRKNRHSNKGADIQYRIKSPGLISKMDSSKVQKLRAVSFLN
ncbi:hypothetical protein J0A68_15295 [Algoriphagus sp. H41]|uniref:Uncharacterized protein n=1 Tax=Algoriphagus oliviformis TaxID=2811231 RepID=A0ABS3C5D5_9BACT|nr:hypothetical protein [Algoriphagus oliviformis]MBN7812317.1 hypothetical protein [Algoriphagus oliviformis]